VRFELAGLGELVTRERTAEVRRLNTLPVPETVRAAYNAFGADRLMWDSDFPLVCGREGYANALDAMQASAARSTSRPWPVVSATTGRRSSGDHFDECKRDLDGRAQRQNSRRGVVDRRYGSVPGCRSCRTPPS
jgi:hypothetical protein